MRARTLSRMASKASASAKAGGGSGTSVGGGVKSTQTPVFGSRVAKTRMSKSRTSGKGRR